MSRTLQLTNCNYRFILKPLSPSQAHTPRLSHEVCTFYRAVFGGCMFLLRCDAPGTPLVLLTLCAQPGIVQLQHIDYIRRFSDVSFVSSCGFGVVRTAVCCFPCLTKSGPTANLHIIVIISVTPYIVPDFSNVRHRPIQFQHTAQPRGAYYQCLTTPVLPILVGRLACLLLPCYVDSGQ